MSKFNYKEKILRDNINPGGGFSSDTQQTAPELCYNATISSLSKPTSTIDLGASQSFYDIQNTIKESITAKGGFGMFSASASASYLRSIEDKYYSLSLSYHAIYHSTTNVQLGGYGQNVLTDFGKEIYNDGNNPYFGLVCGDQYTKSFEQGALLLLSINLEFKNNVQKEEFNAHAGASFGNVFSASGDIQKVASQYSIDGLVSMQAYQIGGYPSQLSKILNKDGNGDYYVLTCSLQNMDNCINAASGMLDYAVDNFPNQISFQNNTGLTPLGIGWASYQPIYYVGLTPPQSFVTPQVEESREILADNFVQMQYYLQRFENLQEGYPVLWNTASDLYKSINKLHDRARDNLDELLNIENPSQGSLGCYNTPDQCVTIKDNILANLNPFNNNDLVFLKGYEGVQYSFVIKDIGAYIYKISEDNWSGLPVHMGDDRFLISLESFEVDNISLNYTADARVPEGTAHFTYAGISSDGGDSYTGTAKDPQPSKQTYYRDTSPFYFEIYNGTDSEMDLAGESIYD